MEKNVVCKLIVVAVAVVVLFSAQTGLALTVPSTEEFDTDVSNWYDSTGGTLLTHHTSGGPGDGAYASGDFNFVNAVEDDTPVIHRGHSTLGASGGAFAGNWLEAVDNFSVSVRHNAPMPLTFFARFSGPANHPGAVAINFVPVLSNAWTPLSVSINPANPKFVTFEGTDFNTVFGNIGNVQVGVSVPAAMAGVDFDYTFDIDTAAITPEPLTLGLLGTGALLLYRRRKVQ